MEPCLGSTDVAVWVDKKTTRYWACLVNTPDKVPTNIYGFEELRRVYPNSDPYFVHYPSIHPFFKIQGVS